MTPAIKKKRVSKNKKKNWRKYSNITDVENFLEDKRFEERTGGPVSEKKNESLFYVDKTIKKKKKKTGKNKGKVKNFKCFQFLEPCPWSEPFIKANRTRTPEERKTPLMLQRQLIKEAKKFSQVPPVQKKEKETFILPPNYDLWENKRQEGPKTDYELDIDIHKKQAKNVKVPKFRYEKPSELPSVEIPHPGASYNPAFDDYQELLQKAVDIELKKKKEEEHLHRVLTSKFPTKDQAPTEKNWFQEMSQCLQIEGVDNEDSDAKENEDSDAEALPNPTVRVERKPRAKRRREEKQKKMLKELQKNKTLKKQLHEIYRIKSIKTDIRRCEEETRKRIQQRKKKEANKRFMPAKISRNKYVAPDLEVCTANELCNNLREIKVQGSLAEDRLKSFQRRNVIETNARQTRKLKYKRKRYVKKSHK